MKNIIFFFSMVALCAFNSLSAQTHVNDRFHKCEATMENHALTASSGGVVTFKPSYPCLIIGGFTVANNTKTIWGVHDPATLQRWDSLATIEAKNGAIRFIQGGGESLPEDALFMPGTFTLDWQKLAGYAIPANVQSMGVSVLIFSTTAGGR